MNQNQFGYATTQASLWENWFRFPRLFHDVDYMYVNLICYDDSNILAFIVLEDYFFHHPKNRVYSIKMLHGFIEVLIRLFS